MESNEIGKLLDIIQFRTGKTLEEISADIGYSRPYLNKIKLKGGGQKVLGILNSTFREVLQNVNKMNTKEADKDPLQIIANLSESNRIHAEAYLKMAEAQLILANKVNSGAFGSASEPFPDSDTKPRKDLETLPLGSKQPHRSAGKKGRQKGNVKSVGS